MFALSLPKLAFCVAALVLLVYGYVLYDTENSAFVPKSVQKRVSGFSVESLGLCTIAVGGFMLCSMIFLWLMFW